jgi:hypothetical protein
MQVERRAAIHQLMRDLIGLRVGAVANADRAVIVTGENVWHAVYRFDGPGFSCWDFFEHGRNPKEYDAVVSDRLLSTADVVGRVRRMRG